MYGATTRANRYQRRTYRTEDHARDWGIQSGNSGVRPSGVPFTTNCRITSAVSKGLPIMSVIRRVLLADSLIWRTWSRTAKLIADEEDHRSHLIMPERGR